MDRDGERRHRRSAEDAGVNWKDIGFIISGSQLWGGRKGIYSGTYTEEVMGNAGRARS